LAGQPAPAGLDGLSVAPVLLGRGPAPSRRFFWHFPHYNNQGGRPSGAVRDGDWMFVEYYDDQTRELYQLSSDIGERHNLAAQQPARVNDLAAALATWREAMNAQANRPNPDFDPARYRALYQDVDPGRFDPAVASATEWQTMQEWRRGMNEAPTLGAEPKAAKRAKKAR
jgi:arylsulfatase A-like enzyme